MECLFHCSTIISFPKLNLKASRCFVVNVKGLWYNEPAQLVEITRGEAVYLLHHCELGGVNPSTLKARNFSRDVLISDLILLLCCGPHCTNETVQSLWNVSLTYCKKNKVLKLLQTARHLSRITLFCAKYSLTVSPPFLGHSCSLRSQWRSLPPSSGRASQDRGRVRFQCDGRQGAELPYIHLSYHSRRCGWKTWWTKARGSAAVCQRCGRSN